MALTRPDVWFGLALNRDPNDPNVDPVWVDFTSSLEKVSGLERGRNFELDEAMAADPELLIRDVSELLNPANPASPYVNLVESYREACLLGQWPAAPSGGNNNLFNTGSWKGNKEDVRDGSFESFAAGVRPSWALPVGATAPIVGAATPFQGTKDLTYAVASNSTQQGFSWPVACIPGRQYTASVYVRQSTASTQRISVADQVLSADPFNLTGTNGWGTDLRGNAWTPQAGGAALFSWSALTARISADVLTTDRIITVDTGQQDSTTTVRLTAPDPAAVGVTSVTSGLVTRCSGSANYYNPMAIWRADGTVGLATFKRVAGARSTVVAEVATGWTYKAGQEFILETITITLGTNVILNSTLWPVVKPRPLLPQNTASDASLLAGTQTGTCVRVESASGVTLPLPLGFAAFNSVGYVHGTTTAATGAYTRLSVTWTATEPTHTVQLATTGTAVAGTVLADAIQHERAAAASAYATTGPVVYPILRNLVEQFPRTWGSAGFEGFTDAPCVDGLAALNMMFISSEYPQAVLDSGPDYYWRLNDGADTLAFADTSGNGQPALRPLDSKYGPGPAPEPGTAIALAGDPSASGVFIDRITATGANTILAAGAFPGRQPIAVPPVLNAVWSASFSAWVQLADDGLSNQFAVRTQGRFAAMTLACSTTAVIMSYNLATGASASASVAGTPLDNTLHHLVGTIVQDATNTTITVYLDDVASAPTVVSTASVGGLPSLTMNTVEVGGGFYDYPSTYGGVANGVIAHAAVWNRALTAAEVDHLYSAGSVGFNGETSGGRITRHLDLAGYTGPRRISQDIAGEQTVLQAPSWSGQKDVATDSQETTAAEQGMFWFAPDGAAVFESRNDRWLRLTPSYVLGENTGGGEIPYMMDSAKFTPDPLFVYANVQIGRINGVSATGGSAQDVATARRRYFPRGVQADFDFYTDDLAQGMAHWIFYTHRAPLLRVDALVIDPASNPALWPFALSVEVGQRVTVKRRAKAANSGAGITMSADYFVEKVGIDVIDFESGEWSYRVQLSPINAGGIPSMQPWIVGDAVYGVVGVTTIPAW